jgi:hypothetical protein
MTAGQSFFGFAARYHSIARNRPAYVTGWGRLSLRFKTAQRSVTRLARVGRNPSKADLLSARRGALPRTLSHNRVHMDAMVSRGSTRRASAEAAYDRTTGGRRSPSAPDPTGYWGHRRCPPNGDLTAPCTPSGPWGVDRHSARELGNSICPCFQW